MDFSDTPDEAAFRDYMANVLALYAEMIETPRPFILEPSLFPLR